ncbi:MAG: DNA polymerase IV [Clostridia bacterium]|nr:DNA polymerase IV [Clostridia bacterium]
MCNAFDKSGAYGVLLEKSREIQSGNIWRTEENGAWGRVRDQLREDAADEADQPGDRVILHCDCNCFFASVEMAAHPEYRGVPMAVCGSQFDRHGIVLAKNDLAKKAGVSTGEAIWQAKLKCPSLVIAPPHYALYEEYSRCVNRIYYDYTDLIEPFGIDESWLDVTGSTRLFGSGKAMADDIRRRVREETGITVSVGVSFNKTFAKLGSDYKKPDATTVITRSNFKSLLYPLPVGDMMYIGRHTVPRLRQLGIYTIGDMAEADPGEIARQLGKTGVALISACRGLDDSPVSPFAPAAKSYGNGMTFLRDLCGKDDYFAALAYLTEKAGARMRADSALCRTVSVSVRDTSLNVITRQKKLPRAYDSTRVIESAARELLLEHWDLSVPARSLHVCCSDISPAFKSEQLKLFYTPEEEASLRDGRFDEAVDGLRARFGKRVLTRGSVIKAALMR